MFGWVLNVRLEAIVCFLPFLVRKQQLIDQMESCFFRYFTQCYNIKLQQIKGEKIYIDISESKYILNNSSIFGMVWYITFYTTGNQMDEVIDDWFNLFPKYMK